MYIPNDATRYTNSSPGPRNQLFDNPVTCDLIMLMTVLSFAILLVTLIQWLRSCIAPEDEDDDGHDVLPLSVEKTQRIQHEEGRGPQPLGVTPTADGGKLLDNEAGGDLGQIGIHIGDSKWYNVDRLGPPASDDGWVEAVYDPSTRTLSNYPGA